MEFTSYTFEIRLDPKPKKNGQKIAYRYPKLKKDPFILPDPTYSKYEKLCKKFMPTRDFVTPITYPVNIKCEFYREARNKVDISNLFNAIDDVLVKYGIIADDCRDIVAGHNGSVVLLDAVNPRTIVTITPVTNYTQWADWSPDGKYLGVKKDAKSKKRKTT